MDVKARLAGLDQYQQRHRVLAIPVATVKKFIEDRSSTLASMMAFWAFFSIFPLMLATVTLLGYVLPSEDKQEVMEQISSYVPLLDAETIGGLDGHWFALVGGFVSALWSATAVLRVTQHAFNSVWEVPLLERPKLGEKLLRSAIAMSTIGVGLLASTLTIGFVAGDDPAVDLGPAGRIAGFSGVIVVDIGIFVLAFRLLTDRRITVRDVLPGAAFSGVMFWVLQGTSSLIITRYLSDAESTYGTFATVITILWWFYLQSLLTLLGAQVNVVLKKEYYPRSLVGGPTTEADHRRHKNLAEDRLAGQAVAGS